MMPTDRPSGLSITLHIGPHKTGTTAIQQWLLDNRAALLEAGIYYPVPESEGPGHALIAWDTRGRFIDQPSHARFEQAVAEAANAGASRLLLSAEDFSYGLYDGALERLPGKQDFEIIVTLNDLRHRFVSQVYESVKHKHHFDFDNFDYLAFINMRPGLSPDLIARVVEGFPGNRINFVMTSKEAPVDTFRKFNACLGTDLPLPEGKLVNPRNDAGFIEITNFFNARLPDASNQHVMGLSAAIQSILAHNGIQGQFKGLVVDDKAAALLDALWRAQLSHLDALAQLGKIRLL